MSSCPVKTTLLFSTIIVLVLTAGRPPYAPLPIPISYVYGYGNRLLIAEVTNARQDRIAYTSFESPDPGHWTYAGVPAGSPTDPGRTGTRYYPLTTGNDLQRTGLPSGRYVLSYWANGEVTASGVHYALDRQSSGAAINGWTHHEKIISLSANNGSIRLSGSGKVDEVRLHPFDARMVTYTYDPLVGKTSETDANNATLYYDYDEFNRLKRVRDQKGNIIQHYVYHYKGQ